MITLQPISQNIQQTLYEKIEMLKKQSGQNLDPKNHRPYIIGTPGTTASNLNLNYMMARVPWLRMTSFTPINENNEPIIIMGGELNSPGYMAAGFTNQVRYGQTWRHMRGPEGPMSHYDNEHNRGVKYISKGTDGMRGESTPGNPLYPFRPLAGVKDISIEYKGGGMKLGATRTGEINWTCWTWEELDRLTPHFLDAGRSILLEWGWSGLGKLKAVELLDIFKTGDEGQLDPLHIAIDKDKIQNLNQTILSHIQKQNGHYDAMLGKIQDFSWDVNETGGFDCTTTLIAQGVNIIAANEKKSMSRGDKFANLPLMTIMEEKSATTKTLSSLAPYISYLDYMEDFKNQILNYNSTDSVAMFAINVVDGKDHAGFQDGGAFFVSWGYFEDNVLSRFLSSVTPEKKVVGEFRSIEQRVDDAGVLMKTDDPEDPNHGKPEMVSTRFTNCRYLITTDSAKWVIPNQQDPFLSKNDFKLWKGRTGMIGAEGETKWHVDGVEQKWHISKNPVIQHFAPRDVGGNYDDKFMEIRNIFFNVKYLQKKCKGSGNLMKVVDDIWNDFSDEYGGVYKFKVEFDDNTNRLLVREEGYSRFDVSTLIESLYANDKDEEVEEGETPPNKMINPLFEFPTMKDGSIVKTQTISAKLPDRMKQAAMYGQRSVAKGTDDKNEDIIRGGTYDDIAGLAWGRMAEAIANPPDEEMSEEEKKGKRYRDIMSGDVDFPSRGNRAFGNVGAHPNLPLIIGNTPTGTFDDVTNIFAYDESPAPAGGASTINKTILGALNTSQQKYLINRRNRIKKSTGSGDVKITPQVGTKDEDSISLSAVQRDANELIAAFDAFSATGTSKKEGVTITPGSGFDLYEVTSGEGDDKTKYTWSIKPEAHNMLDKLLRGSPDGILKNINPLIPIDFEIEVDGTGGMFPGNSFHSAYLGGAYKDQSLFQMVGVNHVIDGTGWFTTIKGQIRAQSVLTKGVSHLAKQVAAEIKSGKDPVNYEKEIEKDKQNCKKKGGKYDERTGGCILPKKVETVPKDVAMDVILIDLVSKFVEDNRSLEKHLNPNNDHINIKWLDVKRDAWVKVMNHVQEEGQRKGPRSPEFWRSTQAWSTKPGGDFQRFSRWFNEEIDRYWSVEVARELAEQEKQAIIDANVSDDTNTLMNAIYPGLINYNDQSTEVSFFGDLFGSEYFTDNTLSTAETDKTTVETPLLTPGELAIKTGQPVFHGNIKDIGDPDVKLEVEKNLDAAKRKKLLTVAAKQKKEKEIIDQKMEDLKNFGPLLLDENKFLTIAAPISLSQPRYIGDPPVDHDQYLSYAIEVLNNDYDKRQVMVKGWFNMPMIMLGFDKFMKLKNFHEMSPPDLEPSLEPSGTGTADDPFMNMSMTEANVLAKEANNGEPINFYLGGSSYSDHYKAGW